MEIKYAKLRTERQYILFASSTRNVQLYLESTVCESSAANAINEVSEALETVTELT